jgi:hypothetical protein
MSSRISNDGGDGNGLREGGREVAVHLTFKLVKHISNGKVE